MTDTLRAALAELVACAEMSVPGIAINTPGFRWYDAITAARAALASPSIAAPDAQPVAHIDHTQQFGCVKWNMWPANSPTGTRLYMHPQQPIAKPAGANTAGPILRESAIADPARHLDAGARAAPPARVFPHTEGVTMTRDEAIAIARISAMNDQEGLRYTPNDSVTAKTWMPHEWVIEAMMQAVSESDRLLAWLDNNTTFYNTSESAGPVLASVSKRIWYHATDDTESYPFSAVAAKAAQL